MKNQPGKVILVLGAFAALTAAWLFDPTAFQLRLRYPHARITDSHDFGWFLPGFLHARWAPVEDRHFGRYLLVELSDQSTPIDCSGFAEFPVFLIVLNRCKVTDLQALISLPARVSVLLNDCDLSGLPESQRRELEPLDANRLSLNPR